MKRILLASALALSAGTAFAASADLAEQARAGLAEAGISGRPVIGDNLCLQERYCQMDIGEENMMVTVRGQVLSISQANADRGQYVRACAAAFAGLSGLEQEKSSLFFDVLFDETEPGMTKEGVLEGVEVTLKNNTYWECSFYKP